MNRMRSIIYNVCCLAAVWVFAGCAEQVTYPKVVSHPISLSKEAPLIFPQYRIIGRSVQQRPILCTVIGEGHDVTLVLAAIHGDEPAGAPLVRRLAKHLQQNPQLLTGRTVVLLPIANPDGFARNTRHNANGVNLNRNFATANRINTREFGYKALSEPEARAIEQLIREYSPNCVVSIHQSLACIDYDGPASSLANRIAQQCDLPVKKIGAKPGSLGSYAGLTLGIPIVTFEMAQSDSTFTQEALWQKYGNALLAAIAYPGTVEPQVAATSSPLTLSR